MTARPLIYSFPPNGVTSEGIVDAIGGRSIVMDFVVDDSENWVLKGHLLELVAGRKVKKATPNASLLDLCGVAISSAALGEITSALRNGVARLVVADGTPNMVPGDDVSSWGLGLVCKLGSSDVDSNVTTNSIGKVSSVGFKYVDVEINLLAGGISSAPVSASSESSESSESSLSSESSQSSLSSESSELV